MSKREQEQNFGEGSAMSKPKQMSPVQAKAKPRNLVSQASHCSSRWSERGDSNAALSNPEIPKKALTKPRNLVSQASHCSSRWSERGDSNAALSNPEIPKKAVTQMTGVNNSSWKRAAHECDTSYNVEHSQVRTQENVQSTKTWKQETGTSSNGTFWKRVARTVSAAEIQTVFCDMKIDYLSKICRLLMQKLRTPEGKESFAVEASKTNILMW